MKSYLAFKALYETYPELTYIIKSDDDQICSIDKFNKSKTLAIGDSLSHDILGANKFGIKSVLITSGLHSNFFFGI